MQFMSPLEPSMHLTTSKRNFNLTKLNQIYDVYITIVHSLKMM